MTLIYSSFMLLANDQVILAGDVEDATYMI